jgi:hypothetical protein
LLLSVFPILVVFAALAGTRLNSRLSGKVAIGTVALAASLAMTAVYHAGYSDSRSDKMRKPLTGDVMWSVPTLVTLNPIGAPIAHAGLHTSPVLHSYETGTFLPPHTTQVGPFNRRSTSGTHSCPPLQVGGHGLECEVLTGQLEDSTADSTRSQETHESHRLLGATMRSAHGMWL